MWIRHDAGQVRNDGQEAVLSGLGAANTAQDALLAALTGGTTITTKATTTTTTTTTMTKL
jgi:hypothetical protein